MTGNCGAVAVQHPFDHRLLGEMQKDPLAKRFGPDLRGRSVFQRALDRISHRANAVGRKQSFSMGAEYFRDPTDIRGNHRHSRRAGLYYDVGH